jgi:dihydroxyacid dehydratase/phosphogluconate dehydratase
MDCGTVTGQSLGANIAKAENYNPDVIRSLDNPVAASGGLVILQGNLAPDGAVIKPAAAEAHLLKHTGRAIVFDSYNDMNARIDDPALEVDRDSGPLALVKEGDLIELDVENRVLNLQVDDAELERRRTAWTPPPKRFERGYGKIFMQHIQQADKGCDFDFLEGDAPTAEPEIH